MADPSHGQGGPGFGRGLPGPLSGQYVGLLARLEVEGGPWVLLVPDGPTYHLLGDLSAGLPLLGRRVQVTGRLNPDVLTSAQVGPVLEVTEITGAD